MGWQHLTPFPLPPLASPCSQHTDTNLEDAQACNNQQEGDLELLPSAGLVPALRWAAQVVETQGKQL